MATNYTNLYMGMPPRPIEYFVLPKKSLKVQAEGPIGGYLKESPAKLTSRKSFKMDYLFRTQDEECACSHEPLQAELPALPVENLDSDIADSIDNFLSSFSQTPGTISQSAFSLPQSSDISDFSSSDSMCQSPVVQGQEAEFADFDKFLELLDTSYQ